MIQRLTSPEPARLARLAAVHEAAFAPDARGWSADEIASLVGNGALFAEAEDRAFALFSQAADEAELLTVAVDPAHQRQGLARALLTAAEADLTTSGAAKIFLEVAADNHAAAALYRRLGYQVAGVRKVYYRRRGAAPVDAAMMAKPLGTAR